MLAFSILPLVLMDFSSPFQDYEEIVSSPMDLTTVHTKLATGHYNGPLDMYRDIRLIFQNSKLYNTNKRSRVRILI